MSDDFHFQMVCVERILEYSRLPPEQGLDIAERGKGEKPPKLPDGWPEKGEIVFNHVSLKYAEDGPNVLHDLAFVIRPGEKVIDCIFFFQMKGVIMPL